MRVLFVCACTRTSCAIVGLSDLLVAVVAWVSPTRAHSSPGTGDRPSSRVGQGDLTARIGVLKFDETKQTLWCNGEWITQQIDAGTPTESYQNI
jgi:hypothetical protein